MGRPPCCDKVGIKKGPWTPEEDIILVSYIQEHGPGNWRAVPTNTGLMRCSKSCRLRWTNYLRPGIKRGNFTPHEEGMIIHLQALLGNKWAAIATYLPQRTDNDIKNYWNTHLKKKLKKLQSNNLVPQIMSSNHPFMLKQRNDDDNSTVPKNQSNVGSLLTQYHHHHHDNSLSTYASSEENISRLLEGWMQSSTSPAFHSTTTTNTNTTATSTNYLIGNPQDKFYREFGRVPGESSCSASAGYRPNGIIGPTDQEMAMWSVDHRISNGGKSSCDSSMKGSDNSGAMDHEQKIRSTSPPPLSFLEKWLLEESGGGQVEEIMDLPSIF